MVVGKIYRVSGPLVVAEDMSGSMMYEVVEVGYERLIGEIIGVYGDKAFIQVYEDTTGLTIGEPVRSTGWLLSAELGPGLITSIFDGIQRPLPSIEALVGPFIKRGVKQPALPRNKKWEFIPRKELKINEKIFPGTIIGYVKETPLVTHKIMVPPNISGKLTWLASEGNHTIEDPIATVESNGKKTTVYLYHKWPVRKPRPVKKKINPEEPLITGIKIIDFLFPLAKGGKAAIPGGFGTGKTVTLQELTKWSYANVTIYIGCGERGNEMADALHSFLKLKDPRSGRPLIERSVFIANTSNMPVAAREASIYMGITIAEYFRDMGYDVLLVADSTSRWAEAMREISGRLEEMPGEEGFPAYLGSRIAEFYERAGRVITLGDPERIGSITVVGAVSPPGADFSEPVTQNTLRYVRALFALDVNLANRRHFPAINWLISYSLYVDEVSKWWSKVHPKWSELRRKTMEILQREAELSEIVRLVGPDALPESDKLVLEVAKMIREDFLFQSAYHPIDKHSPPQRTLAMIETILTFYEYAKKAVEYGVSVNELRSLLIRYKITRMRDISYEEFPQKIKELRKEIEETFGKILSGG